MKLLRWRTLIMLFITSASTFAAENLKIAWGKPMEGVIIGFWHNTNMPGNGTIIIYACQTTNYARNLLEPANEYQTVNLILKDENGLKCERTIEGRKFGASLETKETRIMKNSHHLFALPHFGVGEPQQIVRLEINDCFVVAKEGDYNVEIQPRLLKADRTNNTLVPVIFSTIKTNIHLHPSPNNLR